MSEAAVWTELAEGDVVRYEPRTPDYGRAEFIVCTRFRGGQTTDVWIVRAQQHDAERYHATVPRGYNGLYFANYAPGGDAPRVWITGWCKEHRSHSIRLYVPQSATHFRLRFLAGSVSFEFGCQEQKP